jgi:hypothetical protein
MLDTFLCLAYHRESSYNMQLGGLWQHVRVGEAEQKWV